MLYEITKLCVTKAIKSGAFYRCSQLATVNLCVLVMLEEIGFGAFRECRSLHEVTIPPTIKEIEGHAFYWVLAVVIFEF